MTIRPAQSSCRRLLAGCLLGCRSSWPRLLDRRLFVVAFFVQAPSSQPCFWPTVASCSASSSSGNFSVSFHGCGTSSRQAIAPTCILLVAGHHGDVQAGAVEDRPERVEPLDLGAHEEQRHRRSGHVGDHQVVDHRAGVGQPQRGDHPHGEAEGPRRGELGPVLQGVGRDRLVVVLGVVVGRSETCASRSSGSATSVPSREKIVETLLLPPVFFDSSRTETGTEASSEVVGQLVALLEVAAQRSAAQRDHHVVDGRARRRRS